MWSYTTYHPVKRLHTDNTEEYIILELQFFLREQGIIYETRALYTPIKWLYWTIEPHLAWKGIVNMTS